jgi:hypothetical protein
MNWEIPMKEASALIEAYHAAYPGIRQWHRKVQAVSGPNRTVENLYGRKRRYLDRYDTNLKHQMYAFSAQSVVADHINEHGVCEIYFEKERYRGTELLLQVHDSVLFQIHKSVGYERMAEIINNLIAALNTPIEQGDRELVLPADCTIYQRNFKDGVELNDVTAESLQQCEDSYDLAEALLYKKGISFIMVDDNKVDVVGLTYRHMAGQDIKALVENA